MPFQGLVHVQPAPAVEGDFCSTNPRYNVLAGPGALVAGADGCVVGKFGWVSDPPDPNGTPSLVANTGEGPPDGFVGRHQQALLTEYLAESSMDIPRGFAVTLFRAGDFWARNAGDAANTMHQKVFADKNDGSVKFGDAGASVADAEETHWFAGSIGAPGELVKIYNRFQG